LMTPTLILTLPDGATREVEPGTLPLAVIESIGPRLARDSVAVSIDGAVQDVMTPLRSGGSFVGIPKRTRGPLPCCGTPQRTFLRLRCVQSGLTPESALDRQWTKGSTTISR